MNDQIEIVSNISKRKFLSYILKFDNGYFISISEEKLRIGSISVSLAITNQTNTAKVIQDKSDQLFIDTLSRRISLMINGICIISFFTKNRLQFEDMKTINDKILKTIEDNKDELKE
ncbi:MAG: hypothetical protein H0X03_07265 [Nitrosopumilus sp.]|nr:hypothetical protein [Nitrosopumilus sp.]